MNRLIQRRISSSLQKYHQSSKRYLNQNVVPPKTPKPEPGKTTEVPKTKKSSFPFFTLLFLGSTGSLLYLAVKVEQEDPFALQVADQPVIRDVIGPFITAVQHSGRLFPAKEDPKSVEPPVIAKEVPKEEPRDPNAVPVSEEEVKIEEVPPPSDNSNEPEVPPAAATDAIHSTEVQQESTNDNSIEVVEHHTHAPKKEEDDTHLVHDDDGHDLVAPPDTTEKHERDESISIHEIQENKPHSLHHDIAPSENPSGEVAITSSGEVLLPLTHSEQLFRRSSTSNDAVGEVLSNVTRNSIVLRQELEAILLKDIHHLDANALRIRITQLVGELFERLSWESIRITQSVIQVEKELNEKYSKLLETQRKELEFEIHQLLFQKEKEIAKLTEEKSKEYETKYQIDLQNAIKAQAEGFQQTLQKELEAQAKQITTQLVDSFNNHLANVQKQHYDQVVAIIPQVEGLSAEVRAYSEVLTSLQERLIASEKTHQFSSALLGLELLLTSTTHQPQVIEKTFIKLKELSQEDPLIVTLIDSIPSRVKEEGVLTLSELQVRFQILHEEVRKVALAPEGAPTIVGQFIGSVLAAISLKPKGYITGNGVEETMARAAYQLERGKLKESLYELESIEGYSKILIEDWKALANDRLIVDQALQTLKADSLIRHKSFR